MAKEYYVKCRACQREYYLDQTLYRLVLSNPSQKLKCPFCKKEFNLGTEKEPVERNEGG